MIFLVILQTHEQLKKKNSIDPDPLKNCLRVIKTQHNTGEVVTHCFFSTGNYKK